MNLSVHLLMDVWVIPIFIVWILKGTPFSGDIRGTDGISPCSGFCQTLFKKKNDLSIWLCWILVVAHGIVGLCSIQGL